MDGARGAHGQRQHPVPSPHVQLLLALAQEEDVVVGDVLLAEAGQDPPGVSWQGVKRAEGTPRRRTNTPAPPSARMDVVTAASSPIPRCAVPTSLCGSPLPLLVPSQALQQKPASPHREGPKARALRSCFAALKDLGCFGSFPCRVQGFAPAAAGGSACGAGCGVSGVAGGLPKIPAVSPRAAGLRRLQFASETGKEKREILQFSKWLRGEVEVAAQAGDGCGVQTSATPPTYKWPGHLQHLLVPKNPYRHGQGTRILLTPRWLHHTPEAEDALDGVALSGSPAARWVLKALCQNLGGRQPHPTCPTLQPCSRLHHRAASPPSPTAMAPHPWPHRRRGRDLTSQGPASTHGCPTPAASSQGTEALPSPCSPLPSHFVPVPIPSTGFSPLRAPPLTAGEGDAGQGLGAEHGGWHHHAAEQAEGGCGHGGGRQARAPRGPRHRPCGKGEG